MSVQVGIEAIDIYAGRLEVDAVALAERRGREAAYAREQVMVSTRTVVPPWEDAVTLAVNAGARLFAGAPEARREVGLVVVATESAVDFGKPVSTWAHRFLELPAECRSFEVKHACYGGTAALTTALAWVRAGVRPGKKALVISADLTRPAASVSDGYDFIGGGCAAAMLVSDRPDLLAIDPARVGSWTHEIADTFRPSASTEIADNETSLYSYLDALEGAADAFERNVPGADLGAGFDRHVYHSPFPGMTLQAHRALLRRAGSPTKDEIQRSYEAKVRASTRLARRLGSAYGASNALSLAALLGAPEAPRGGERVLCFSYGSGCQGELYEGVVGAEAGARVRARGIDAHVDARLALSLDEYEALEVARAQLIERPTAAVPREGRAAEAYQGQRLLVLEGTEGWVRNYAWI